MLTAFPNTLEVFLKRLVCTRQLLLFRVVGKQPASSSVPWFSCPVWLCPSPLTRRRAVSLPWCRPPIQSQPVRACRRPPGVRRSFLGSLLEEGPNAISPFRSVWNASGQLFLISFR